MVMGGRGAMRESADRSDYATIIGSALELYPALRACEWEFVWGGKVAVTLDHLPHLHELAPGVHAALGYNGRGVAMATVMGKVLADRVLGRGAPVFPESPLWPVPLHRWRRPFFELIVAWKRALDRLEGISRRP
jgi:glycine/D-amino acid oxidase-like deaminating enzyme